MEKWTPPFPAAQRPHGARMEEMVARLWRDLGIEPPRASRPLAPLAAVLEECALSTYELPLLTRRTALGFLSTRGICVGEHAPPDQVVVACGATLDASGLDEWNRPLAGFLFANAGGGCVFVRGHDPIARRRFSAAHELGHFVLHFVPQATQAFARAVPVRYVSTGCADAPCASEAEHRAREEEADAFAAEILMPTALVCEVAASERGRWCDSDLIWQMSQEFLVSRKAMWVRLRQLGWVSAASPYNG